MPGATAPIAVAPQSRGMPAHRNRRLTPATAQAIRDIMARPKMKPGAVMREMGFDPMNPSLGLALHRDTQLQPDVLEALDQWLAANATPA